jgi:hypothetical protein
VFRDLPLRDVGQHPLFLTIYFLMVFFADNWLIFFGTGGSLYDLFSGIICFWENSNRRGIWL